MAVYSNEKMEKIAAARRLHQRQYAAYRKAIAQGKSVWDAQRAADAVQAFPASRAMPNETLKGVVVHPRKPRA
jgi:hypothetical protein